MTVYGFSVVEQTIPDGVTIDGYRRGRERHCANGHRWLEYRTGRDDCPTCGKTASADVALEGDARTGGSIPRLGSPPVKPA